MIGIVDLLLPGSQGSMGANIVPALFALPIVLLLNIPFGILYVDKKKSRSSVRKFVNSKQKELDRWYSKPIVQTFAILLGSCIILLYDIWTHNPLKIDFRSIAINSGALLAFPFAMPFVYFVMKSTLRRARSLLEQMLQEQ